MNIIVASHGVHQGCRRQPGSLCQEAAIHFRYILPIIPERERPLQAKMSFVSSFLREAQEHLLYCNAQVYSKAKCIQGEGKSPALEIQFLRRSTSQMSDNEGTKLTQPGALGVVYDTLKTQENQQ